MRNPRKRLGDGGHEAPLLVGNDSQDSHAGLLRQSRAAAQHRNQILLGSGQPALRIQPLVGDRVALYVQHRRSLIKVHAVHAQHDAALPLQPLAQSSGVPRHTLAQRHIVFDLITDAALADRHVELPHEPLVNPRYGHLLADVLVTAPDHHVPPKLMGLEHQAPHLRRAVPQGSMSTRGRAALLSLAHEVDELREGLDVSLLRFADRQPRATKRALLLRCHQPQELGAVVQARSIPHSGTRPYPKAPEMSSLISPRPPRSPGSMLRSFCWPRRRINVFLMRCPFSFPRSTRSALQSEGYG